MAGCAAIIRYNRRIGCGDVDITRWLGWFLDCMGRATDGSEQALAAVRRKAKLWQRINLKPVNERQRLVISWS